MKRTEMIYTIMLALKYSAFSWLLIFSLAIVIHYGLYQVDKSNQRDEIVDVFNETTDIYQEFGDEYLLQEFELERYETFPKDEAQDHWHDEGWLIALYRDGQLILGGDIGLDRNHSSVWKKQSASIGQSPLILHQQKKLNDSDELYFWQRLDHDSVVVTEARLDFIYWLSATLWLPIFLAFFMLICIQNRKLNTLTKQLHQVSKTPDSMRLVQGCNNPSLAELNSAINQVLDKISQLHNNIRTMSVGVAHDLKTPLTRVANRLHAMHQDKENLESLSVHLNKASEDLEKIISTFNNLVRLNSIESGKYQQGFKAIQLSELLLELADSFYPVFEDVGKTLDVSVVPCIRCTGDQDLLSQLVCNLLENALEYSQQGASVWLRLQAHSNGILLQIGDSGPGIKPADKVHIFERFYRGDVSRSSPGNGLGLCIVKAICDIHNAEICLLDDQPGAVFNIEIPIR